MKPAPVLMISWPGWIGWPQTAQVPGCLAGRARVMVACLLNG
jgi:hypothetical protein